MIVVLEKGTLDIEVLPSKRLEITITAPNGTAIKATLGVEKAAAFMNVMADAAEMLFDMPDPEPD